MEASLVTARPASADDGAAPLRVVHLTTSYPRHDVPKGAVVFGDTETSYLVAAAAPVYVAAAPPAHVADTTSNHPRARARDVHRFLRHGDLAIPRRYGARWIVLDRRRTRLRLRLPRVWSDGRYTLYRLPTA